MVFLPPNAPGAGFYFRELKTDPPGTGIGQPETADDVLEAQTPQERLVCRQCGQIITDASQRISVDGSHQHTFANPHGIVYEIGCFQAVSGCGASGAPSEDFSWFRGYRWRIILCINCLTHLGWSFNHTTGHSFFGLILDRLITSFDS